MRDRQRAKPKITNADIASRARDILNEDPIFMDTETTGLDKRDVIEIGIVDSDGSVRMEQRVRPALEIEPGAEDTHGISMDDLEDEPNYLDVHEDVMDVLKNEHVSGYNTSFDLATIRQSAERAGYQSGFPHDSYSDVMELSARWYGDWSEYHRSFTWKKLGTIASSLDVTESSNFEGAHGAVRDADVTRLILEELANLEEGES